MTIHVAFFNRSFYPDVAATGQLLTELCEGLGQDHGCRITVVAGVSPLAAGADGDGPGSGLVVRRERYCGIEILRARGTRLPKDRFAGRFANYISYFLSACYAGLLIGRPDVVVALTDPPIIGLAGYLAARRHRARFVVSYRDIFPEVATLLEDFRSHAVNRLLDASNRFVIRRADALVALGESMRRRLVEIKGADPRKVVVIPDGVDCREIAPAPKDNPFSRAHGLVDQFVVMHSGNIGLSQGLETLLEAAALLQGYADIRVVFVGDGVKKAALTARARQWELRNVTFLPYQPREALRHSFAAADVFLVSLKRGLAGYVVPSKVYGILAAGRPYIAAAEQESEPAVLAVEHECGLLAAPGDAQDLARKILMLYHDRRLCQRLGANARRLALRYDRRDLTRAYFELFAALAAPPGGRPQAAPAQAARLRA